VTQPSILSSGMVVVRESPMGLRYLLLRVYNYWDFPKGEVEKGETPLAAAFREVAEETGIADLELPWGEDWYETPPYHHGKVVRYYLGRTRSEAVSLGINPQLGRPEHHGFRWVSTGQARRLLNGRVNAALSWAERLMAPHAADPGDPPP
jgi:bis(5'-nucleosidyl)-tetraphosphatase